MLEDNAGQYMYMYLGSDLTIIAACSNIISLNLPPKKQQKQVADKNERSSLTKNLITKKPASPKKSPETSYRKSILQKCKSM